MALSTNTTTNSLLSNKSLLQNQPLLSSPSKNAFFSNKSTKTVRFVQPIAAVHSSDSNKNPIVSDKPTKSSPPAATATTAPAPAVTKTEWAVDSWKSKKALQLPEYPDQEELRSVLKTIDEFPPIVFAGEARSLEERLGEAAMGRAFLLQGGDCAESFKEFNANNIRDTFRILLQMGAVLMFGGQMPVIKVGRMAGQFAKPRSDSFEEKDGVKLPSYRGDNVNGDAFDVKSRTPDPQRLIRAYCQSAATLNLLRAFATGGYAAMQRINQWNLDFTEHSEQGDRYRELASRVDEALGFMTAAGLTMDHPIMKTTEFWTSHECLLLPYEQSLTRRDSTSGLHYDCSAHFLWVGERTRQLDGAHVEFLRGIANPLGIKVSDKMDPSALVIDAALHQPGASRRTPFTDLSQVDADLALARTLQDQERAYMMLSMNDDGIDYGSWDAGNYGHDEDEDEDFDDPSEEDDGSDVGEDDEDAFDVHAHDEASEDENQGVELDPSAFSSDEAYARALQDAEEREMAARLLALAGINEMYVGQRQDEEDRGINSQDAWEDVDPDELSYEELIALGDVVGTESRGLSADTIASLPSVNYKTQTASEGTTDSCVICRLDYEDGEKLTVLSCKHTYHSECLNNWLQINKVCPICSTEVSTSGNS